MTPPTADGRSLTISEAQEEYKKIGENAVHKGYRDVIKALVKSGYSDPIKNDSYADALFLTDLMFEHADKSVCMLTGAGADGFIKTLKNRFEEMLVRIKANGGSVRIIALSETMPECLSELTQKFSDTLSVSLATAKNPIKHFIICDGHMLRTEEPHGNLQPQTPATDIKAEVLFNSAPRARFAESFFNTIWEKVTNR